MKKKKQKLAASMFDYTEEYGYKLKSNIPGQYPYDIAKMQDLKYQKKQK